MREGLPHGFVGARDMSGTGRSASGDPLSSMSERDLMKGYRWNTETRIEDCACGGEIESLDDWRAIAYAVEVHNGSTVHQQWRAWQDLLR